MSGGGFRVDRHGTVVTTEWFPTWKAAIEREVVLQRSGVPFVVAWFDSESAGPWVEPIEIQEAS